MKKRFVSILLTVTVLSSVILGCGGTEGKIRNTSGSNTEVTISSEEIEEKTQRYKGMSPEEIVATLTLEQKIAQMVQPAVYEVTVKKMKKNCYGSILSKSESVSYVEWQKIVDEYQIAALQSSAGIPYLYGQDDVHGVNYATNTVIFPHNIGLGAANDPELMYQVGLITADEAKLCHMMWNFSPCVAQSVDPRWGRTYESYGSNLDIITELSTQYTRGLIDGGIVACAKHFFADGNVSYGTGEDSDAYRLIDRGDSSLSDEEIKKLLAVYQSLVDTGVQTIMISHSSLNGLKMHENAEYIQYLKNEMGFEGFIVSDWNSVQNIPNATYYEQVVKAVNAGIDMLMEVDRYDWTMNTILQAVEKGEIIEERIDDAVTRIIRVKQNLGLFEDPMLERMTTTQNETGSAEYRAVAEKLVEESLVLVKNEGDLLPLKAGTSIYVTGPALDNGIAQCGGWTLDWNGSPTKDIPGLTTILEGFESVAAEKGITVIQDSGKASEADVVVLVVGESAYAEWYGDTKDMELCGSLGLSGNEKAIKEAKALGKPIVTLIVAGRNVIIDSYVKDWNSIVMCYLPGSEGQGVANVICGKSEFSGKLPSPWYANVDQIGTNQCWLPQGYSVE